VFDGEPGAWPKFISHWLLRSVLIMPGLVIGGIRDRRIIPAALASSTFVSLFLVFYTAVERGRRGIPVGRTRNLRGGSRPVYSRPKTQLRPSGGTRFFMKKYGLTPFEADRLILHPNREQIVRATEQFQAEHGYPAPNSSLVRGYLLDRVRAQLARRARGARRALGTRYRVSVRTPKLSGTTSICVEAKNKAEATALIHGSGRGVRVTRITRGC